MSEKPELSDAAADVAVSDPVLLGRGFRAYERYDVVLNRADDAPLSQQRDVVRGGKVAAVLAIDLERDEIVLIRQFRLAAHLATGFGEMIEVVAGRVDAGEDAITAARRECAEEIGVVPKRVAELFSVLPTPGLTDEFVTLFAAFIDADAVPARGGVAHEDEDTRPLRVGIDAALAALDKGRLYNALLITALQWLALNRTRLREISARA